MRQTGIIVLCLLLPFVSSGCLLTRVLTMPMRVGGAVLTIIPVAGDAAHEAIDDAAAAVDEIPF